MIRLRRTAHGTSAQTRAFAAEARHLADLLDHLDPSDHVEVGFAAERLEEVEVLARRCGVTLSAAPAVACLRFP